MNVLQFLGWDPKTKNYFTVSIPYLKLTANLHLKMDGTGRGSGFLLGRRPIFRGELLVLWSIIQYNYCILIFHQKLNGTLPTEV